MNLDLILLKGKKNFLDGSGTLPPLGKTHTASAQPPAGTQTDLGKGRAHYLYALSDVSMTGVKFRGGDSTGRATTIATGQALPEVIEGTVASGNLMYITY